MVSSLSLMDSFATSEPLPEVLLEAVLPGADFEVLVYAHQLPEPPELPVNPKEVMADMAQLSADEAQAEPVVDPQQWLTMMLNQQSLQLQARDYLPPAPSMVLSTDGHLPPMAPMAPSSEDHLPWTAHLTAETDSDASLGRVMAHVDPGVMEPGELALFDKQPQVAEAPGVDEAGAEESQQLAFLLSKLARRAAQDSPASAQSAIAPAEPLQIKVTLLAEAMAGTEPVAPAIRLPSADGPPEPMLDRRLKLAAPQARWGEQMLHALRETVEVQVQQRFQQATIRLDPPELGSLEIFISHESGRLSVHLAAAQSDVARLLNATSERLRQELLEQNSLQVSVQVSSDSQGRQSREQPRQPLHEAAIAAANAEAQETTASSRHRVSDVLVTV